MLKIITLLISYIIILIISGSPLYALSKGCGDACALYNEARNLEQSGKYNESLQKVEQALKIDPNYAYAYTLKGLALYKQEKDKEALIPLKKAIDLYEKNGTNFLDDYNGASRYKGYPYFWYAGSLFNLERYNESSDIYSKAITAYENYIKALDKEPVVLFTEVVDGKTEYIVMYPDDRLGPMNDDFKTLVNATKSDMLGTLADAYYWKGFSLYEMGLSNESMQYYNKAIAINQTLAPYSQYE